MLGTAQANSSVITPSLSSLWWATTLYFSLSHAQNSIRSAPDFSKVSHFQSLCPSVLYVLIPSHHHTHSRGAKKGWKRTNSFQVNLWWTLPLWCMMYCLALYHATHLSIWLSWTIHLLVRLCLAACFMLSFGTLGAIKLLLECGKLFRNCMYTLWHVHAQKCNLFPAVTSPAVRQARQPTSSPIKS